MKKEKLQTVQESIQTQDRTYDKSAKNIIATRQFLSIILHERVPEFRPFPLELIERDCIEGTPWIEEIPIDPSRECKIVCVKGLYKSMSVLAY